MCTYHRSIAYGMPTARNNQGIRGRNILRHKNIIGITVQEITKFNSTRQLFVWNIISIYLYIIQYNVQMSQHHIHMHTQSHNRKWMYHILPTFHADSTGEREKTRERDRKKKSYFSSCCHTPRSQWFLGRGDENVLTISLPYCYYYYRCDCLRVRARACDFASVLLQH